MIFNEIKCHFNTCLGLVGGMYPRHPPLCPPLNIITKYAVSFPNSVLNINKLTKPKKDGAYDFADVSTYACLTYVKHITPYIRAKINKETAPSPSTL